MTDVEGTISDDSNCDSNSKPPLSQVCEADKCRVLGYYTNWSLYARDYNVEDLPWSHLTHILYAFWDVDSSGNINTLDWNADFGSCTPFLSSHTDEDTCETYPYKGNFQELKLHKEIYPDVKLLLSLGGWTRSTHFSNVMISPTLRSNLCDSILSFHETYSFFDGIDIDWEFPGMLGAGNIYREGEDGANFELFASECAPRLKTELPDRSLLFTIATGCHAPLYQGEVDFGSLSLSLDYINLMSYDFYGTFSDTTGHNSPLFSNSNDPSDHGPELSSHACVEGVMASGAPASQLNLGMGLYGRAFSGVDMNGGTDVDVPGLFSTFNGAASGTWEAGILDYKSIVENYIPTATVHPDSHAMVPVLKLGDSWVSYEDVCSTCNKVAYMKSVGIEGGMFWETSADTVSLSSSLIYSTHCGLNPSLCEDNPCDAISNQGYTCDGAYGITEVEG